MLTDRNLFSVVLLTVMSRGPHTKGSKINGRSSQNVHGTRNVSSRTSEQTSIKEEKVFGLVYDHELYQTSS